MMGRRDGVGSWRLSISGVCHGTASNLPDSVQTEKILGIIREVEYLQVILVVYVMYCRQDKNVCMPSPSFKHALSYKASYSPS